MQANLCQPNPHGTWYRPMASQSLSFACSTGVQSEDLSLESLPAKFQPKKGFSFPKRKFGGKKEERSFRAEWCDKYTWLHYDIVKYAAYCYTCMKAGRFLFSTKYDPSFITRGFTYWKDETSAFQKHQASCCHCEAVTPLKPKSSDIGKLLSIRRRKIN